MAYIIVNKNKLFNSFSSKIRHLWLSKNALDAVLHLKIKMLRAIKLQSIIKQSMDKSLQD